jgi:hypothetical protein
MNLHTLIHIQIRTPAKLLGEQSTTYTPLADLHCKQQYTHLNSSAPTHR